MAFDPEDQEIIRLLAKLKQANEKYPEDLLAARRSSYLQRMSELGLGVGAEEGIKQAAKHVKAPATAAPVTSTILEMALVVAIIAETGAVAYFYRDKLTDFFKTISAQARGQEVTPAPVVPTTMVIQGVTPSPVVTPTLPSATLVTTPSGTPIPGVVDENSNNNAGVNLLNSTPAPNENDENNGNNGHHYGQTPKPERTKENGNNPPPKENNDKPPKDNGDKPPTGNNDKPPKDNNGPSQNDKQPKKP